MGVRCDQNGRLEGAYLSDGCYNIISMFFDEDPSLQSHEYMDEGVFADMCTQRADAGYNSGMGEIFRKVAAITPIMNDRMIADSSCSGEDGPCSDPEATV